MRAHTAAMTSYGPLPQQQPQSPPASPAGWYADPLGRHQLRYYDGSQWTEHVSSNGTTSIDPPVGQSYVPTVQRAPENIRTGFSNSATASGKMWIDSASSWSSWLKR